MDLGAIKVICKNDGVRWINKRKLHIRMTQGWKPVDIKDTNIDVDRPHVIIKDGMIITRDSTNALVLCYKPCVKTKGGGKKEKKKSDNKKKQDKK